MVAFPYLCFPGIHDCPVYIKDEPTFRMAKILWNEIEKIYAKPEPVVTKPPVVLPQPAPVQVKQGLITEPATAKKKGKADAARENAQAPKWTDKEKTFVDKFDDPDEAWKAYQKEFPGQRGKQAIKARVWSNLRKKRGKRKDTRFKSKWLIPFDAETQATEYQTAWKICRKYDRPYPEALKLKEAADATERQEKPSDGIPAKDTKSKTKSKIESSAAEPNPPKKKRSKSSKQVPCPYCKIKFGAQGLHRHIKGAHKEKYDEWLKIPDQLHHGVHQESDKKSPDKESEPDIKTLPETLPPAEDEVTTKSLQSDSSPVRQIRPGDNVRHTTAYPLFPGVGTVKKISLRGDEVLVDFGNGTEWLDRKNLEVVPGEGKA